MPNNKYNLCIPGESNKIGLHLHSKKMFLLNCFLKLINCISLFVDNNELCIMDSFKTKPSN